MAMDPVCGMQVDEAAPKGGSHLHGGKTYYFCSAYCHDHFAAKPEDYQSSPDPVDGSLQPRDGAAAAEWHDGRAWFFSSSANRDRFMAAPQDYGAAPLEPVDAGPCPVAPA